MVEMPRSPKIFIHNAIFTYARLWRQPPSVWADYAHQVIVSCLEMVVILLGFGLVFFVGCWILGPNMGSSRPLRVHGVLFMGLSTNYVLGIYMGFGFWAEVWVFPYHIIFLKYFFLLLLLIIN